MSDPMTTPPTGEGMTARAKIESALRGKTWYEGSTHYVYLTMPEWNAILAALRVRPAVSGDYAAGLAAGRAEGEGLMRECVAMLDGPLFDAEHEVQKQESLLARLDAHLGRTGAPK